MAAIFSLLVFVRLLFKVATIGGGGVVLISLESSQTSMMAG